MRSRERAGPPGGSTAGPPAARSAKCVCALSLSANKDRGAAANDVVSKPKRGHHSDGRRLPENLRGEIRLKAQESDTNKFVPEYPLRGRQPVLRISMKKEKMQISRPPVTKQIILNPQIMTGLQYLQRLALEAEGQLGRGEGQS